MQNVPTSGVSLRDTRVGKRLKRTDHVDESVSHLEPVHPDSFQEGGLLLLVFQVDRFGQHWGVYLRLLDVHTQVDDETENLVVAVVHR